MAGKLPKQLHCELMNFSDLFTTDFEILRRQGGVRDFRAITILRLEPGLESFVGFQMLLFVFAAISV